MLSVYVVSVLASLLLGFSLRSFWTGVLGSLIVLSACDFAVYYSGQSRYVGPIAAYEVVSNIVDSLTHEIAVAEQKAAAYEKCIKYYNNKAWGENQVIPSHKSLHNQCLKVAAERSLP